MIEFCVGEKVLIEFSTFGDRFLGIIADVTSDGRLVVYCTVPKEITHRLDSDDRVLVRFAEEGVLRGFRSRVLNAADSPDLVFELAQPHDIFDAEDRCEPRCSCHFPATVVEGGQAAQAVVEDMSSRCSRVRFLNGGLESFVEGFESEVRLTFHPFDMGDGYSVGCVVRNTFIKDGARYAVLEFNPNETDACGQIERFVEAQVCCGIPRI
ncbi:flagellar brake protein [Pseudodesulfovibrio sp.]|nr:flagellar brake protein [Pseudodesulfovibrio sp.]